MQVPSGLAQGRQVPTASIYKVAHAGYLAVSPWKGKLEVELPAKRQRRRGLHGNHAADPYKGNLRRACCQGSNRGSSAKKRFQSKGCFSQALLGKEKERVGGKGGQRGQAVRLGRASLFQAEGSKTRVKSMSSHAPGIWILSHRQGATPVGERSATGECYFRTPGDKTGDRGR